MFKKIISLQNRIHISKQTILAVNFRLMNMRRSQTKLEVKKKKIKLDINLRFTTFREKFLLLYTTMSLQKQQTAF